MAYDRGNMTPTPAPLYVTQGARMGYSDASPPAHVTAEAAIRMCKAFTVIRCNNGFRVSPMFDGMGDSSDYVFTDTVELIEFISGWASR